jgi:hypothetical protein
MNTSRTTARFEHSSPFAAHRAFGNVNTLRRQRVIGGEGTGRRLETLAACVTGNPFRAPDLLPLTGRDDCGFSNEAALLSQRTTGGGLDY